MALYSGMCLILTFSCYLATYCLTESSLFQAYQNNHASGLIDLVTTGFFFCVYAPTGLTLVDKPSPDSTSDAQKSSFLPK